MLKRNSGGKIDERGSWKRDSFAATSILILRGHVNPFGSSDRRIGENGPITALTFLHVNCYLATLHKGEGGSSESEKAGDFVRYAVNTHVLVI